MDVYTSCMWLCLVLCVLLSGFSSPPIQELCLSTVWDDDLCYLLSPALASYEMERCLGVGGISNEEFQDSIRNIVPDGHSFKGFPLQLLHRDPHRAFAICLRSVCVCVSVHSWTSVLCSIGTYSIWLELSYIIHC